MRKIETIWHNLLYKAFKEGQYKFTQQDLAAHFGYSLSTVHHALDVPSAMGAIRKEGKFFILQDFTKLLYYWASVRSLARDIIFSTHSDMPVKEIEKLALPGSIFAGYTAARYILGEPPADYAKTYVYLPKKDKDDFAARFESSPKPKQYHNVFALLLPHAMPQYGDITTPIQTYVDIWNMSDWYSKDFLAALEQKLRGVLS